MDKRYREQLKKYLLLLDLEGNKKKKIYMTQKWFLLNEKKCLLLSAVRSEKTAHVDIICRQVINALIFQLV